MSEEFKAANTNAVEQLGALERRTQVLKYRKAGASLRQIAEKLKVSHVQVHRDLKDSIAELSSLELEETRELQTLELARLDDLLVPVWPNAVQGSPTHIDMALKILAERRKILGLDNVDIKMKIALERETEALLRVVEMFVPPEDYVRILAAIRKVEIIDSIGANSGEAASRQAN